MATTAAVEGRYVVTLIEDNDEIQYSHRETLKNPLIAQLLWIIH